jgi:hypothetical protein
VVGWRGLEPRTNPETPHGTTLSQEKQSDLRILLSLEFALQPSRFRQRRQLQFRDKNQLRPEATRRMRLPAPMLLPSALQIVG